MNKFERAANDVMKTPFRRPSCCALAEYYPGDRFGNWHPMVELYQKIFGFYGNDLQAMRKLNAMPDHKNIRVLMLLMMATCYKDFKDLWEDEP